MTHVAPSRARLTVERRSSDGAVVATELCATYPLRLHLMSDHTHVPRKKQKALCCYLLGYGGGLVSGDHIVLDVSVNAGAALVVTSQSTSKAFRARKDRPDATLQTNVKVMSKGLLVWAPQPTQCFRGSRTKQSTDVLLSPSSSLLLLDWYTGGRPNLDGGGWRMESFETCTTMAYETVDGPVRFFRDASVLSGGDSLQRHMRGFHCVAMVVLVGPLVQDLADGLLLEYSSRNSYSLHQEGEGLNRDGIIVSCGTFPTLDGQPDGVLLRLASHSVEQAARFISKHVGTLDGQLDEDPFMEILVAGSSFTARSQKEPSPEVSKNNMNHKLSDDMIAQSLRKETTLYGTETPVSVRPSTLYQLVDASAPTGGFAHSNTLETAFQLRLVDASSLLDYTHSVLLQTLTSQVPFLVRASSLFQQLYSELSGDGVTIEFVSDQVTCVIDKWRQLDHELSLNTTSQVASRASRLQGSGTLRAFSQTFPHVAPILHRVKATGLKTSGGHAATCFGAVCGLLGVDPAVCASMYCYTTARDMINAAIRMNILGPLEGGRLINELCRTVDDILDKQMAATTGKGTRWLVPESAHQAAPLVEVLANAHDRLYSRLFNS